MSDSQKISFLRVLIAAAWADGEITYEEMNAIKEYFRQLDLTDDEYTALEPYLTDPLPDHEARLVIEDFLRGASGGERETVLAALRDLFAADGDLDPAEVDFMDELERGQEQISTVAVFVGRLKQLWRGKSEGSGAGDDGRFRRSELVDEFVRNRVLYQVKRRLLEAGGDLDADAEDELRWVCALGALLGRVALADRDFADVEKERIAEVLDSSGGLHRRDVVLVTDIVESEILRGVDSFPFVRELADAAGPRDRERVLALLFEVAAADGDISHAESEEIRAIAKALKLDREQVNAARARASEKL